MNQWDGAIHVIYCFKLRLLQGSMAVRFQCFIMWERLSKLVFILMKEDFTCVGMTYFSFK